MKLAFFDAKNDFRALDEEPTHLNTLAHRVSREGWPKDAQEHWLVLTAMAASIEKCYSGVEKILKNLIHDLDGDVPSSSDWHRQLIERAASVGPHERPPVLDNDLALAFHDLRSFRHRERNSYVSNMDPDIVLKKAIATTAAMAAFGERIDLLNAAPRQRPSH